MDFCCYIILYNLYHVFISYPNVYMNNLVSIPLVKSIVKARTSNSIIGYLCFRCLFFIIAYNWNWHITKTWIHSWYHHDLYLYPLYLNTQPLFNALIIMNSRLHLNCKSMFVIDRLNPCLWFMLITLSKLLGALYWMINNEYAWKWLVWYGKWLAVN